MSPSDEAMIWNYLKVALRRMRREKTYAAISILSLAVGLAVSLLIGLNIYHELSWDDFHEKADRIYRVAQSYGSGSNTRESARPPMPLGPTLVNQYPQVERAVRIESRPGVTGRGDERFEERVLAVDSTFFEVFSFRLRSGDPNQVLRDPASAVLSAETAERMFGDEDPLGQSVSIRLQGQEVQVTVEGVAERLPSNSSIVFDILITLDRFSQVEQRYATGDWVGGGQVVTYVELSEGSRPGTVEDQFPDLARRHLGEERASRVSFSLQPLTDVHFLPDHHGSLGSARPLSHLYILAGLGLLVVFVAGVNFVTISLARSSDRYREVGIRKTVGARREQVAGQFWGETFLTTALGFGIGAALATVGLPLFNRLIGKELALDLMMELPFMLVAGGLLLLIALLAGSYPALALSGHSPTQVFYGLGQPDGNRLVIRGLLVLQLALSAGLVAGVLVMNEQVNYLASHDPGFDAEQLIRVDFPSVRDREAGSRFVDLADNLPEVESTSGVFGRLTGDRAVGSNGVPMTIEGQELPVQIGRVDAEFLEMAGLTVLRGRSFRRSENLAQPVPAVVNETFVEAFGLEDVLGLEGPGVPAFGFDRYRIVGVVRDFHFKSLRHEIEPLMLFHDPRVPPISVFIRASGTDLTGTVSALRTRFKDLFPDLPFDYHFVDDRVEQQYRTEERWAEVIGWASAIGLGLAGAGLFGLALMAARRREKEISIRKVLGATVTAIVGLFSREFLKMAVLGVLVGLPAAYLVFNRWLSEFAYRIDLGPGPFLWAAVGTLFLVWVSVSYQSIRAALVNPSATLRNE